VADIRARIAERPAEAFQAFEASLRISKNRLQSYAGEMDDARTYYGKLVELAAGSDGARPEIAEAKTFIEVGK